MKRRAIDPVVATLILIIIAVVAAVTTYSFVTNLIAQTTTQAQSPSSIVIDAAVVDDDAGSQEVKAYVRNIGPQNVRISAIYILDADGLSLIYSDVSPNDGSPPTIAPNSVATVYGDADITTDLDGQWVIVKVVADDGSSATLKVKGS